MRLSLDGPVRIADRDLELRPAYVLEARFAFWEPGSPPQEPGHSSAVRHYLDGDLLVARVDCDWRLSAVASYLCEQLAQVSWQAQGAPAPFGFGWPEPVRYQVDGEWVEWATRVAAGREMPAGALLPKSANQAANLQFKDGPNGLPASFVQSFRDGNWQMTLSGTLRDVEWGTALDPIAPWPMAVRPEFGARTPRFIPGEGDEAFGMGITYLDAYEQLLALSPEAARAAEQACVVQGGAFYGGGSRWTVEPVGLILGDGDNVAFHARFANGTTSSGFEIRYQRDRGLLLTAIRQGSSYWLEDYGGTPDGTCPLRSATSILGANEALRAGWTLGLAAGIPCNIHTTPAPYWKTGSHHVERSGQLFFMVLTRPISNDGWDQDLSEGVGLLWIDAEDGRLRGLSGLPEDLRALDSGTLQHRPLPVEQRNAVGDGGAHCVPPDYAEFP